MTGAAADRQTNATMVASTVGFALARRVSVHRLEAITGIGISGLIVPNGRFPLQIRDALWGELATQHGDCIIPVDFALSADLGIFDGLADGVRCAPHLYAALTFLSDNCKILGDHVHLAVQKTAQGAALTLMYEAESEGAHLAGEASMIMLARLLNESFCTRHIVDDIVVAAPASGPDEAYHRALGLAPRFGSSQDTALMFSNQALAKRPVATNPAHFEMIEAHFAVRRRLLSRQAEPTLFDRLLNAVGHRVAQGDFTAEGAAREAHMSVRTAQRLTALHGRTLKGLIADARVSKARQMLASDPEMPVETIATALGYSDERAFRRAFQRWTDVTPAHYRRLLQHDT